jgi:hypothetical protein
MRSSLRPILLITLFSLTCACGPRGPSFSIEDFPQTLSPRSTTSYKYNPLNAPHLSALALQPSAPAPRPCPSRPRHVCDALDAHVQARYTEPYLVINYAPMRHGIGRPNHPFQMLRALTPDKILSGMDDHPDLIAPLSDLDMRIQARPDSDVRPHDESYPEQVLAYLMTHMERATLHQWAACQKVQQAERVSASDVSMKQTLCASASAHMDEANTIGRMINSVFYWNFREYPLMRGWDEIFYQLSLYLKRVDDTEDMLMIASASLRNDPESPWAYDLIVLIADEHLRRGRAEEALSHYRLFYGHFGDHWVAMHASSAYAMWQSARCSWRLKRPWEGVKWAQRAVQYQLVRALCASGWMSAERARGVLSLVYPEDGALVERHLEWMAQLYRAKQRYRRADAIYGLLIKQSASPKRLAYYNIERLQAALMSGDIQSFISAATKSVAAYRVLLKYIHKTEGKPAWPIDEFWGISRRVEDFVEQYHRRYMYYPLARDDLDNLLALHRIYAQLWQPAPGKGYDPSSQMSMRSATTLYQRARHHGADLTRQKRIALYQEAAQRFRQAYQMSDAWRSADKARCGEAFSKLMLSQLGVAAAMTKPPCREP